MVATTLPLMGGCLLASSRPLFSIGKLVLAGRSSYDWMISLACMNFSGPSDAGFDGELKLLGQRPSQLPCLIPEVNAE